MWRIVETAILSGTISILGIVMLLEVAPERGWVSRPKSDRWNKRVVVLFGGAAILLGYLASVLLFADLKANYVGWLTLLTLLMATVGFLDDLKSLPPRSKLLLQFAICGMAVATGVVHPLSSFEWINRAFTLVWLVGVTNALNLIDNMDGLAGGIAAIGLLQILFLFGPNSGLSIAVAAMLGAILGFLIFNFNPAKIFMGDAGSLPIGFFLACASVRFSAHLSGLLSTLLVPTLILFLPLFDTFLVSVTRLAGGRAISHGARDHSSHRMVLMGMSERKAVLLLYLTSALAAVGGILWKRVWTELGAGMLALFLIAATLFWLHLAKLSLPRDWISERVHSGFDLPLLLDSIGERLGPFLTNSLLIAVGLYLSFVIRFESLNRALYGQLLFGVALCIAIKLPLLHFFGVHKRRGRAGADALSPVFKACGLSGTILFALSYTVLPWSKSVPGAVVVADFFVTSCLLIVAWSAERIFRDATDVQKTSALPRANMRLFKPAESFSESKDVSVAHRG